MDIKQFALEEISRRTENAKVLAAKFPELKGLSFSEFLEELPMDLDFITAREMHEAINS